MQCRALCCRGCHPLPTPLGLPQPTGTCLWAARPTQCHPCPLLSAPALEALVPTAFASAASKPERQRLLGRPCHGRGLPCPFQDTEGLHGSGGPPGQCLILPSSLCLFALCAFCVCYLFNPSILHTICSAAISSTPPAPLYWEHTLGVVFYVCWKQ